MNADFDVVVPQKIRFVSKLYITQEKKFVNATDIIIIILEMYISITGTPEQWLSRSGAGWYVF
jgi:hypothetical protein